MGLPNLVLRSSVLVLRGRFGRMVGNPSLTGLWKVCPLSANDQQALGDMALLVWPFTSKRLPEAFL